jgi:hypothetical protein
VPHQADAEQQRPKIGRSWLPTFSSAYLTKSTPNASITSSKDIFSTAAAAAPSLRERRQWRDGAGRQTAPVSNIQQTLPLLGDNQPVGMQSVLRHEVGASSCSGVLVGSRSCSAARAVELGAALPVSRTSWALGW